jgi:hypothetical protein
VLKILVCVDLKNYKVQREISFKQGPVVRHYIVLFFLYEFSYGFSWNIFNELMCTQGYVYLLIFLIRVFIREIIKTYIILILFSFNLSHGVIWVFLNIHDQLTSFFPYSFWRIIHDDHVLTDKGGCYKIILQVTSYTNTLEWLVLSGPPNGLLQLT